MVKLPDLNFEEDGRGGYYAVDIIMPGFIEASAAHQFGEPTLPGTRIPTNCARGWLWEAVDGDIEEDTGYGPDTITREHIIAARAFELGRDWQRSRNRRKRIDEEVSKHHKRFIAHTANDYEPGDEKI